MKKIINKYLLSLVVLLTATVVQAEVTFNGPMWYDYRDQSLVIDGKGTIQAPIVISSPEQLAQVAWLVNEQNYSFEGKFLVLDADINLEKDVDGKRVQWIPIGYKNVFKGSFSGVDTRADNPRERHRISGMYIDVTMTEARDIRPFGLFGECIGFIGYLNLTDATVNIMSEGSPVYKGTAQVGLLCGSAQADFTAVSVEGTINMTASIYSNVGGICGQLLSGEISHSTAKVTILCSSGATGVGGICGTLGIDGSLIEADILDCAADVDISCPGNKANNVGGIVGVIYPYCDVTGCISTGTVHGGLGERMGGIAGIQYWLTHVKACTCTISFFDIPFKPFIQLGGITGELAAGDGFSSGTTIEGCVYAGFIDGTNVTDVGGICGHCLGEKVEQISYCISLGTIKKPTGRNTHCGAIIGDGSHALGIVVGCYYDRQLFSGDAVGGQKEVLTIIPLTTRELTSGDMRNVVFLPIGEGDDYDFTLRDGFYPMINCYVGSKGNNPLKESGIDVYPDENRLYQSAAWLASLPVVVNYGDCADDFVSSVTVKNLSGSWMSNGLDVNISSDCLFPDDECIAVEDLTASAVSEGTCLLTINGEVDARLPIDEYPAPINVSRQVWLNVTLGKVWDGSTASEINFGTGTAEDPYLIKNGAQLAYAVSHNKVGEFYQQICDITLNANAIDDYGIGSGSSTVKRWVSAGDWNAYYDGCGHFVRGTLLTGDNTKPAALFGNVTAHGTITGVGMVGSSMRGIAAPLAYNMDGRISNCIVQGVYQSLPVSGNSDGQYDRGKAGGICYAVGPNNPSAVVEDCVGGMFSHNFLSDYTPFVGLSAKNQGKVRNCLAIVPTAFSDLNFQNRESYSCEGHPFIEDCYWLKGYEASPNGKTLEEIGQALGKRRLWTLSDPRYFPMLKDFANSPMGKLMTIPVRTDVAYTSDNFLLGFKRHLTFEPGLAEWSMTSSLPVIDTDVDMGVIVPMLRSYVIGEVSGMVQQRQLSGIVFLRAEYEGSVLFIPMRSSDTNVSPGITFIDENARQACLKAFDTNDNGYLSLEELRSVTNEQTLTAFHTWHGEHIVQFPEFRFFKSITELTTQLHGLYNMESVQLPYALQTIGIEAFRDCDKLEEITVSAKVTAVRPQAFYGSNIRDIHVDPFNDKFVSRDGVLFTTQKELVAYPNGRRGEEAVIEGTVKRMADGAFYKVPDLRRLYFDTTDYTTVTRMTNEAIVTDDGSMMDVYVSDATYDKALFSKYQRDASWAAYDQAGKLHQYYPLKIDGSLKGIDGDNQTCYFGTFCIGFDAELPQALTPYIVTEANREQFKAYLMPKSRKVPATAAVVIAAKEPGLYRLMPYHRKLTQWPIYENRLVAADRKGQWINQKDAAQGSILTLGYGADGQMVGFYPEKGKSIEPYKAYLPFNTIDIDPAIAANAHYEIVYTPGIPTINLIDKADNSEVLTTYDGKRVNVTYDRVLSAAKNTDGSWSSRAYTICLPYDKYLYDDTMSPDNATLYRLVSVTDDYEFIFTNDFNYISAGIPYVVVVKEGEYCLDAEDVTISATPLLNESINKVYDTFEGGMSEEGIPVGWWRGTFQNITNEEGSRMHAFGLYDGQWKVIRNDKEEYLTGRIPTFRAYFVPLEHKGNWVYDSKYIYTEAGDEPNSNIADFPADSFDSDLPDAYGDNTVDISPVIHVVDRDGTHRYFDLQGHQLSGRPAHGIYIENGKKKIR